MQEPQRVCSGPVPRRPGAGSQHPSDEMGRNFHKKQSPHHILWPDSVHLSVYTFFCLNRPTSTISPPKQIFLYLVLVPSFPPSAAGSIHHFPCMFTISGKTFALLSHGNTLSSGGLQSVLTASPARDFTLLWRSESVRTEGRMSCLGLGLEREVTASGHLERF